MEEHEENREASTPSRRLQQRYRAAWTVLEVLPTDILLDGLIQPVLDSVDAQAEDVARHYTIPVSLARLHLLRRLTTALDRVVYEDAVAALSEERPADVSRALGVKTGLMERWMTIRARRYSDGNDGVE